MSRYLFLIAAVCSLFQQVFSFGLTTYHNPILPGWHSDPSCTFVREWNNTYFCATSSFLLWPGSPVYASKDLISWKLASHALSRLDQIPEMLESTASQSAGTFASTLRYKDGKLYLITVYLSYTEESLDFLLYTTTNPYDDAAWDGPISIPNPQFKIDPDIFWDDDGFVYIASAGIYLQCVNLTTLETTEQVSIWNGTGGTYPEGPHLYKKDEWYYLLIAEGGTETNHSATIARSREIYGPYESYNKNPILTNRNTSEYFQTVGHADLFQDGSGNWWGAALSTRSGPNWVDYPMGRETVLTPGTWDEGGWPALNPVRGEMRGQLPPLDKNIPGRGPWVDAGDMVDFEPGSEIPRHFVHWRPAPNRAADYAISTDDDHRNTMVLKASRANITTDAAYSPKDGQTFIARLQSHTFFEYSVDFSALHTKVQQEAGISVFLTNYQHIDLSIIILESNGQAKPHLQMRVETAGKPNFTAPEPVPTPFPDLWVGKPVRLQVIVNDDRGYVFSASTVSNPEEIILMGTASGEIVSGGSGPFTGTLLGVFATTNGFNTTFEASISRWRYTPIAQEIGDDELVTSNN